MPISRRLSLRCNQGQWAWICSSGAKGASLVALHSDRVCLYRRGSESLFLWSAYVQPNAIGLVAPTLGHWPRALEHSLNLAGMSKESTPQAKGELPLLLRRFQLWTALLFCCSVLFHLVERRRGVISYAAYPLSSATERFGDFTIFTNKFRYFGTETFFHTGWLINYPAAAALGFEVFFKLGRSHALSLFIVFMALCFAVPAAVFTHSLITRGVCAPRAIVFMTVVTGLSWPVILLIDRGNIEVLVWLVLLLGMWAYSTGHLWTAAACFGVGASLKLFPFVLFGLFLSRRQYRQIFFGAAVFLVVSVGSLKILGPTIQQAYAGISLGINTFKVLYMGGWHGYENGVDHSIFALYKGIAVLFFGHNQTHFLKSLSAFLTVTAIGGLLLYFLRIRLLPLLNQVLILVIVSIYFTAFSGDGTLIHLYYPCAMLFLLALRAHGERIFVPGLRLMLGCMVFILSCETFLVRHNQRVIGQAHCLAIGVLLFAALRYPLGPPIAETRSETILSNPDLSWLRRTRAA